MQFFSDPKVRKALVALLVAALGTIGIIGITVAVNDDDGTHHHGITVELGGPGNASVTVPAPEGEIVAKVDKRIPDQDQRDDPATSRPLARRMDPAIKRGTTGDDLVPAVKTLASFSQPGCSTRPVRNFSSRFGHRPGLVVLHYTVSANRPGTGDVASIVVYFDNPRSQASSNYVVDNEGNCAYIVSELNKAWTQGNMNFASACSFEIVNTGRESTLIGPAHGPGVRKLARLVHDCAHRWGIPIRAGKTSGCTVTRTGVVDHNELACNNFHTDVSPYRTGPVIRAARALDGHVVTPTDRVTCRKLTWWRTHARPHGKPESNAVRRRKALTSRHLNCTSKGPVRAT